MHLKSSQEINVISSGMYAKFTPHMPMISLQLTEKKGLSLKLYHRDITIKIGFIGLTIVVFMKIPLHFHIMVN